MLKKICQLVEVVPVSDERNAEWTSLVGTDRFLLSYSLGDAVTRVLARATGQPEDHIRSSIVVGSASTGRTTFLRLVETVLTGVFAERHPRLDELRATVREYPTVVVRVPPPRTAGSLSAAVALEVRNHFAELGPRWTGEIDDADHARHLEIVTHAAGSLPDDTTLVVLVDDVELWLDVEDPLHSANVATLVDLGRLSRSHSLAVCAAMAERAFIGDTHDPQDQAWLAALSDVYRIEHLPIHSLRSTAASRLLRKQPRQRQELCDALRRLRDRLPELNCSLEEFVETYPIEPTTWTVAARLHRTIESFSFVDCITQAANVVLRRPPPSLFALNDLFTLVEPQLRRADSAARLVASYDALVAEAIPRLDATERVVARLGLQALLMFEVVGLQATTQSLAHAALLYDVHGDQMAYEKVWRIFTRIEAVTRGRYLSTGVESARRLRLVPDGTRAFGADDDRAAKLELAARYLADAETVTDPYVTDLRHDLLSWLDRRDALVESKRLEVFLGTFETYRDVYASHYAREHRAAVGPNVVDRYCNALVESYTWSVLESFSALAIGQQSFLVAAIDHLSQLRDRQCGADPRTALASSPVCRCGFRFADAAQLHATVSEVNNTVQAGIDHHRRLLQERRSVLQKRLKASKSAYDIETIKTIAALAKDGALPYVDMKVISAINELLADETQSESGLARTANA